MGAAPQRSELQRLLAAVPNLPPELTDPSIIQAGASQRRRRGMSRRATFLTGDGDGADLALGETTLLGR